MKKVKIKCPSCSEIGIIEIDESFIKRSDNGITSLNVSEKLICPHAFVLYIDRNFTVRDSFTPDFTIELPKINIRDENSISNVDIIHDIDMYLIRINVKANELISIVNCIYMKKKILFINDNEVVITQITNLIKFLFLNTFNCDFSASDLTTYRNNRKKYKNHIIIGLNTVLTQKKKEIFSKRTKIEGAIVQKFLTESDSKSAIIIFRNEIYKSFIMSETIIEILQNYPNDGKISKKKLVDLLSEKHETKIQFEYLEFLLNIVKNYFGFNLSRLSDYYFPSFGL